MGVLVDSIPVLTNPASDIDVVLGKQIISQEAEILYGTLNISQVYISGTSIALPVEVVEENGKGVLKFTDLSALGTANPEDVDEGVIFSSVNGFGLVGTKTGA